MVVEDSVAAQFRTKVKENYNTLWEAFQDFDADGDDSISRNEFKSALLKVGMELSDSDRKTLRASIDTAKTKKITYEDLERFMMEGEMDGDAGSAEPELGSQQLGPPQGLDSVHSSHRSERPD